MMQLVRRLVPGLPVSLEVEKQRADMELLFPHADLILFSRAISLELGLQPEGLLRRFRSLAPRAELVCSLGEEGAIGLESAGSLLHCSARKPPKVVDTLGAGDTFNAGVIDAGLHGAPLQKALQFACELAGSKCGQSGLHGLSVPMRDF
jgi:ketohexokinase